MGYLLVRSSPNSLALTAFNIPERPGYLYYYYYYYTNPTKGVG
jgi:hypothetical protein